MIEWTEKVVGNATITDSHMLKKLNRDTEHTKKDST